MSNPNDYIVGWICARSTEGVAALAFLDEIHEDPKFVSPSDNANYKLGKIGKHNVVIAVLPDGELGISSAAVVATQMLYNFPNIRIGLLVGIGSGAPSRKHDIRLADIVVSTPRDGNGGVFQYDSGITMQDQAFRPVGFLNQPPMVLQMAVHSLRAQYETEGHCITEAINAVLEKRPRLRKRYKRPDPNSDRLYQSIFVHPSNDDSNCAVTCGDDCLILRPERTEEEDNPAIHYGLIASGNQVMKDALVRDKLVIEKDVLCFDTEAAGVMNHFPCLVIRGICNYSDSHNNKEWQGYAAMTAAAYAKDLLCHVSPNREAEKIIESILSGGPETSIPSATGFSRITEALPPVIVSQPADKYNGERSATQSVDEGVWDLSDANNSDIISDVLSHATNLGEETVVDSQEFLNRIAEMDSAAPKSNTVVGEALGMKQGEDESGEECEDETQQNEVGFDSAIIQSADNASSAWTESDKWFSDRDKMRSVNRFFRQFRKEPSVIDEIPHATIAILDTGIDLDHPRLKIFRNKNQISGAYCRDFVDPGKSPITDSTGHGTHCAHLVLKVCKTAKLYVARVFKTDQGDEGIAQKIALAIEWAVTNKVDIIVMAFAFSRHQEEIRKAINMAKGQREFLIFAAASNNKHNEQNAVGFPARAPEVIRVNSCTWQGHPSNFSPGCSEVQHNLATIGEEIEAAFTQTIVDSDKGEVRNQILKRLSGTSQSAAIMAGVAGLVLEFARTKTEKGPNVQGEERLLIREGMMAILQRCMGGAQALQPSKYRYIKPWLLFKPEAPRDSLVWQIQLVLDHCM